ncbi:hypothetical protein [Limibacillus sp. MBR-115]|uniref:hypothetical protein n=1 Tax=Limibacillus sp. MBR-115 TaxID=3156465 RepID=UPI0033978D7A
MTSVKKASLFLKCAFVVFFVSLAPGELLGGTYDGDARISPGELSLLCQYDKRMQAISNEADARFGSWPSETLKRGQKIPIEGEVILLPRILGANNSYINEYYNDNYIIDSSIKRIQDGYIRIIDIIIYNDHLNYYFVFHESMGVHGFVRSDALVWYNSNRERMSDHVAQRSKWADIRILSLRKEMFEDGGMDYFELLEKALVQGVYHECERWQ